MNDSSEDRMPPIPRERMTEAQRVAADELIAGPRKAVKGPFIPLLRSPELMARLQRVGEYLRFQSALPARLSEFATLLVARHWTQQFEWTVHVPLAIAAGTSPATIATLREGHRPETMSDVEAVVYDLLAELDGRKSISDTLYAEGVRRLGEQGLLDLLGLVGYFTTISMVLNVARTPADAVEGVVPLPAAAAQASIAP
jgi:4-carboxymuconolactone decarboxylase